MVWRLYTLSHSAYFGLYDSGSLVTYLANVALRPITMVCLFGYVTSTVGSDDAIRRVVIGANILVLNWNGVAGPMMTLGWELGNGTIGMNLASPVRRIAFLGSRSLIHVPNGLVSALIGGVVGALVFDIDLGQTNWSVVALAVPLILLSFTALGLLCGVGALVTREVTAFVGFSGLYIYLLSGAIVPLDSLPGWVEALSSVVPGRWGVAALQSALQGESLSSQWPKLVAEAAIYVLYCGIALAAFLLFERRTRTHGSADVV